MNLLIGDPLAKSGGVHAGHLDGTGQGDEFRMIPADGTVFSLRRLVPGFHPTTIEKDRNFLRSLHIQQPVCCP
jgi:hypothetical protein